MYIYIYTRIHTQILIFTAQPSLNCLAFLVSGSSSCDNSQQPYPLQHFLASSQRAHCWQPAPPASKDGESCAVFPLQRYEPMQFSDKTQHWAAGGGLLGGLTFCPPWGPAAFSLLTDFTFLLLLMQTSSIQRQWYRKPNHSNIPGWKKLFGLEWNTWREAQARA